MKKGMIGEFLGPLLVVAAITVALGTAGADLAIEALFYSPGAGWLQGNGEPWASLYRYGNLPAFALGAMGAIAFVLSFFSARHQRDRVASLFIVVFLALGPGLVVNTVVKEYWGRPRPADIVQFGGTEAYRPFWNPGGQGRSFPSGHAAIGFFIMAPFFVLRHRAPAWARRALVAGLFYGALMGLTRMIQGGHYLTDVIWAGCLIYLTGLFLYYLFRLDREGRPLH
ncbi:MAG TPA: phosphatase PAP2 family protein [Syntrophales bacterium]|nr:phosphatase PAP2 family protein [Syntrophales bacterium]